MQSVSNYTRLHSYLEPHQISGGTAGELEAGIIIHALGHIFASISSSKEYVLLSSTCQTSSTDAPGRLSSTPVKNAHPPSHTIFTTHTVSRLCYIRGSSRS